MLLGIRKWIRIKMLPSLVYLLNISWIHLFHAHSHYPKSGSFPLPLQIFIFSPTRLFLVICFYFLGKIPIKRILGSHGRCIFNFLRSDQIYFQSHETIRLLENIEEYLLDLGVCQRFLSQDSESNNHLKQKDKWDYIKI